MPFIAKPKPVSYTHLDVYKRQASASASTGVPWAVGRMGICGLLMKKTGDGCNPASSDTDGHGDLSLIHI